MNWGWIWVFTVAAIIILGAITEFILESEGIMNPKVFWVLGVTTGVLVPRLK